MMRRLALACALFMIPVPSAAYVPAVPPPPAGFAETTLANGLRIVAVRTTVAPVVSVWMSYLAGSDEDGASAGLAHAAEHMMFKGSRGVSADQFAATTGMLGGVFNGETRPEATRYYFQVPNDDLDVALRLEAARATGVLDDAGAWDRERSVISQEVAQRTGSASYRLQVRALQSVLGGTPYANDALGTVNGFHSMTIGEIRRFHRRYYAPNDAVLVIAGDVEPNDALARARAAFAGVPARALPARAAVVLPPLVPATLVDDAGTQSTVLGFVAYRVPGDDSPDRAAARVLIEALSDRRGPLAALHVRGDALATFATERVFPQAGIAYVGSTVPVGSDGMRAVASVKAVVAHLREDGVSDALVAAAKRRIARDAEQTATSVNGLARLWSETLTNRRSTPAQDTAAIARVGADDVNRVLRTWFDNATATVAVATPKAGAVQGRGAAQTAESFAAPAAAHTALPAFARKLVTNLRVPAPSVPPYDVTLPNGLRLIVQPDSATRSVVVRGRVRSNPALQEPAGKEGVARIVEAMLDDGTKAHDRTAFVDATEAAGAEVTTGTSFGLDVSADGFERGLALLAEAQLTPAFDAADFTRVRADVSAKLRGEARNPSAIANQALCESLYTVSVPACRAATVASVSRVELRDAEAYHAAVYRPDMTTVAIVGNVTPERARNAVEGAFGGWHAAGPKPTVDAPASAANPAVVRNVNAAGTQSEVTLAQVIGIVRKSQDYAALRLANAALSGGAYASILYHDLRETKGYVYTVGSEVDTGRAESVFAVYYRADPRNVADASASIKQRLRELQRVELPPDRLVRTKAMLAAYVSLSAESYQNVASRLLYAADNEVPLDYAYREACTILTTSAERVRTAVATYIRPDAFVEIIQGPAAPEEASR